MRTAPPTEDGIPEIASIPDSPAREAAAPEIQIDVSSGRAA